MDEFIGGIKRNWLGNGTICAYHVERLSIATLDAWNRDVMAMILRTPPEQKMVGLLYDLAHGGVSMPYLIYANHKIDEVLIVPHLKLQLANFLLKRADLTIALAVMISSTMSGKIVMGRGRRMHNHSADDDIEDRIVAQAFFMEDEALDWLQGMIATGGMATV